MCEVCGSKDGLVYVMDLEKQEEYWECWSCDRTFASKEEVYENQASESYSQGFKTAEVQAASGFG